MQYQRGPRIREEILAVISWLLFLSLFIVVSSGKLEVLEVEVQGIFRSDSSFLSYIVEVFWSRRWWWCALLPSFGWSGAGHMVVKMWRSESEWSSHAFMWICSFFFVRWNNRCVRENLAVSNFLDMHRISVTWNETFLSGVFLVNSDCFYRISLRIADRLRELERDIPGNLPEETRRKALIEFKALRLLGLQRELRREVNFKE